MLYQVRTLNQARLAPPKGFDDFLWPERFRDRHRPLDLEIGCGVGWHSVRYALAERERNLIAIEQTRAKFEKFISRVEHNQTPINLLPVHADAVRWVTHLVPSQVLDRVFILYPNPEPKAASKRWFRMPFMRALLDRMKPGAELIMATNEQFYRDEALEWATNAWGLSVMQSSVISLKSAPEFQARTHFERKYLLRGETCFDLRFRKP